MKNTSPPAPIMLAQAQPDPGFRLPGAASATAGNANNANNADTAAASQSASPATGSETGTATMEAAPLTGPQAGDTSSRDLAIGGGIFLVLLIVYFFARNAFVNHLVARRVAPSSAGSAGWLLFFALVFISGAAVLAMMNTAKFLSIIITGPLLLVGIGGLIGAAVIGRR
jgi:hypothetical protein